MTGLRTLEFALEEIASARPVTERVRHFKNLEMGALAGRKSVRRQHSHQRV